MADDPNVEPALEPWKVAEALFPADGIASAKLRFLVHYAVLAPSNHNTQPWLFDVHDTTISLRADRGRGLPVVDPDDRELVIACGAALCNLLVAMRHFGYEPALTPLPDPAEPDLLALVDLGAPSGDDDEQLFAAIQRRRTNRKVFDDRPVPDEILEQLEADAAAEGAWLHLVRGEDARSAVGDLIAEADRLQWANKHFRREYAGWVHPNRSPRRDGLRGYAIGFSDLISHAGPFVLRTFDLGKGRAAQDREITAGSPVLAVLGTDGDSPADWLATGQALEKVLLRARAHDVWAAFLNQPVEVPEIRPRLTATIGRKGFPQLAIRMGYGSDVKPEPRRSAVEVLTSPPLG